MPTARVTSFDPKSWRLDPRIGLFVKDDFTGGSNTPADNIGETNWGNWSVGGSYAALAGEAGRPGIVRVSTGAVNNNLGAIANHGDVAPMLANELWDVLLILRLNQLDAGTNIRVGVMDGPASSPPANGAFFQRVPLGANWMRITRSGGVETNVDTGIAIVAGAWNRLRIRRLSATEIGFTVDGAAEQVQVTNLPGAVAVFTALQLITSAAADKTCDLDYYELLITGMTR